MPTVVADLGGALHTPGSPGVHARVDGDGADRRQARRPLRPQAGDARRRWRSSSSDRWRAAGPHDDALIVFRAIQGLGAGGLQPIALTIVGDIFEIEERARMQGVFGAVWGIAGLAGPLLGGVIVGACRGAGSSTSTFPSGSSPLSSSPSPSRSRSRRSRTSSTSRSAMLLSR